MTVILVLFHPQVKNKGRNFGDLGSNFFVTVSQSHFLIFRCGHLSIISFHIYNILTTTKWLISMFQLYIIYYYVHCIHYNYYSIVISDYYVGYQYNLIRINIFYDKLSILVMVLTNLQVMSILLQNVLFIY